MADFTDVLPTGTQPIFRALVDAGVTQAKGTRYVPWVREADDGIVVVHVWRDQLCRQTGQLGALIDYRQGGTSKHRAVVKALVAQNHRHVRVVLLEHRNGARKSAGARFDAESDWWVHDTGTDFWLLRGNQCGPAIPRRPEGFGHLTPERKQAVSNGIERDQQVKNFTLARANHRCEVPNCRDQADFDGVDVHHITPLGDKGSDHTDNTIALCPACHARVHRGTTAVRLKQNKEINTIRQSRLP